MFGSVLLCYRHNYCAINRKVMLSACICTLAGKDNTVSLLDELNCLQSRHNRRSEKMPVHVNIMFKRVHYISPGKCLFSKTETNF